MTRNHPALAFLRTRRWLPIALLIGGLALALAQVDHDAFTIGTQALHQLRQFRIFAVRHQDARDDLDGG